MKNSTLLNAGALITVVASFGSSVVWGQVTVLQGGTVIDGISETPLPDAVIVLEGDTIRDIGTSASVTIPAGADVIDLSGKTIMPGMLNIHVHVGMRDGMQANIDNYSRQNVDRDAKAYLYYGVTHVASLGNDAAAMDDYRRDQQSGLVSGPRVHSGTFGFAPVGGWQPTNAYLNRPADPEEARQMVRDLIANRSPDILKVWVDDGLGSLQKFPPEMYGAIIDEAHQNGLKVFAHMYYLEDAKELVRQGVDVFAHSIRDQEVDEDFLELARESGVTQVARLVGNQGYYVYGENPDFLADSTLDAVFEPALLAGLRSHEYQQEVAAQSNIDQLRATFELSKRNTLKIHNAGIPIAVGTDTGQPGRFEGLWAHREMEMLVETGLTPMEAIKAATINGARALGIDQQYGSLEAGKKADFIVLDANPLDDITSSRRIFAVWQNGKPVDRSALTRASRVEGVH